MTLKEKFAPKIAKKKYLIEPVEKEFHISEGYIYSQEERNLHGNYFHKGIDYSTNYGTPVRATAAGYAVASYHRFVLLNNDFTFRLMDGEPVGNGLGYFVQISHSENTSGVKGGRITQYGHLSRFADSITPYYTKPIYFDHLARINKYFESKRNPIEEKEHTKIMKEMSRLLERYPWVKRYHGFHLDKKGKDFELYLLSYEELKRLYEQGNRFVTKVDQGDVIGYVGISAVFRGFPNYSELGTQTPDVKEPTNNWDEYHLHFEEATRIEDSGLKKYQRDPYDIYKSYIHYQSRISHRTLFI